MIPSTNAQWRAVADVFHQRCNFHQGLRAIDWKHTAIQKPHHADSDFYNKKFHSVIKMAVVDGNCKLIWLYIGTNRPVGDGTTAT